MLSPQPLLAVSSFTSFACRCCFTACFVGNASFLFLLVRCLFCGHLLFGSCLILLFCKLLRRDLLLLSCYSVSEQRERGSAAAQALVDMLDCDLLLLSCQGKLLLISRQLLLLLLHNGNPRLLNWNGKRVYCTNGGCCGGKGGPDGTAGLEFGGGGGRE